jgi:hypothetical protein
MPGLPLAFSPPGRRGDRMKEIILISAIIISMTVVAACISYLTIQFVLEMEILPVELPELLPIIVSVITIPITLTMMKVMELLLRKLFSPGETGDEVRSDEGTVEREDGN